jgi:hypothetical protein
LSCAVDALSDRKITHLDWARGSGPEAGSGVGPDQGGMG